jgi:hypothetical protein
LSIIIDLWPIRRYRDLSPGANDGVRRLKLSWYSPSDLALPDDLGFCLMVAVRMFVLAIFVPTATSSTMVIRTFGSPTTSTRLLGSFFWHTDVDTLTDDD